MTEYFKILTYLKENSWPDFNFKNHPPVLMEAEDLIIIEKVQKLLETVVVFSHLLPSCNENWTLASPRLEQLFRKTQIITHLIQPILKFFCDVVFLKQTRYLRRKVFCLAM